MCYKGEEVEETGNFINVKLSVPHSPYNIGNGLKRYIYEDPDPNESQEFFLTTEQRRSAAIKHVVTKFFRCDKDGNQNPNRACEEASYYINCIDPIFSELRFSDRSRTRLTMGWDIVRGKIGDTDATSKQTGETDLDTAQRVALMEIFEETGLRPNEGVLEFVGAPKVTNRKTGAVTYARYNFIFKTTQARIEKAVKEKMSNLNTLGMGKCPHDFLKNVKKYATPEQLEILEKIDFTSLKSHYGETDEGALVPPANLNPGTYPTAIITTETSDYGEITIDKKLKNNLLANTVNNTVKDWKPPGEHPEEAGFDAPTGIAVFVQDEDGNILVLCGDRGSVKCTFTTVDGNIRGVPPFRPTSGTKRGHGGGHGGGSQPPSKHKQSRIEFHLPFISLRF